MNETLREIVFDTETTGLNYDGDDRVIEIGCVEMVNHTPTGKTYQVYINPEREVPAEVVRVHGITTEFLADKPKFAEIVDGFLTFIGDAKLVAHNASFDINFLNAEFRRLNLPELDWSRVVDTLALSRHLNPHLSRHTLDALCKHYNIDNSHRELHGALLDARLLAEVYIELLGGKEVDFFKRVSITDSDTTSDSGISDSSDDTPHEYHAPRNIGYASDADVAIHRAFVDGIKTDVNKATKEPYPVIWKFADTPDENPSSDNENTSAVA